MMLNLDMLLLLFLGWFLLRGWTRKAFSEDDGNWFFWAVFQKAGVRRWEKGLHTIGYFGIEWLSALMARAFRRDDAAFFYAFKAGWMMATSVAVYSAAYAFAGREAALACGMFFLIVIAMPSTLFALTYGEHMFLLPLALTLTCFGIGSGAWAYFFAGMFAAWIIHIKITGLALYAVFLLLCAAHPEALSMTGAYLGGGAVMMLAPLILIPVFEGASPRQYVIGYVTVLAEYLFFILERLGFGGIRRAWNRFVGSWEYEIAEDGDSYLGVNAETSRGMRLTRAWMNLRWSLRDLSGVMAFALGWLILWPQRQDALTGILVGVLLVCLVMQQVQQNYFTPHFNPAWLPISMLAGLGFAHAVEGAGGWRFVALAILVVQVVWLLMKLIRFAAEEKAGRNSDGRMSMWGFFAMTREVGMAIRAMAREGERLFVWGDNPAIYLYAQRYYLGRASFFLYGHGKKLRYEDWILSEMRRDPPELLLFFKHGVMDSWDAVAVSERTGFRYMPERLFQVAATDPEAEPHNFGLYRLDEGQWRDAMLERGAGLVASGRVDEARACLETILSRAPQCWEARLRLDAIAVSRADFASWLDGEEALDVPEARRRAVSILRAEAFLRQGDARRAARVLDRILEGDGDMTRALILRGEAAYGMGRRGEGAAFLRKALLRNPYSADALTDMAVVLAAEGKRVDAEALLRRALKVSPEHLAARESLDALQEAKR